MQYTIRNISKDIDKALRRCAREAGKSLNEAALDALREGLGLTAAAGPRRDLGDVAGTWVDDPALESALADQRAIDEELWR
jgi:hypothetical protein